MSGQIIGPIGVLPTGGGAAPFALDGSSVTGNTSSANLVLPGLSTTYGNDVVLVAIVTNGAAISTVTSANLTFAREPGLTPPTAGGSTCDLWYAVSGASALSSEVITIGNSGAFTTGLAFALSGIHTAAPFDANGAIPSTDASNGANPAPTITTSTANDFAFGFAVSSTDAAATGYTNMNATALSNFLELAYKFASGTLVANPWKNGTTIAAVATAIIPGP